MMFWKNKLIFILPIFLFTFSTRGNENSEELYRRQKIDELIQACQLGKNQLGQDQRGICNMILELQQIGDDAVETVKALIPLGPFEYFILTVINFTTSGRLRFQTRPLIHPMVKNTIEYRVTGEWLILFNYQF